MSPASPANGALMQPTRTSNPNANKLDRTSRWKFSRLVAGIIPAILIVFLYVSALGLAGCAVTAGPGAGNTGAFKLTTDSLPAGHAGKAYFSTLAVAGGIAPFSWSVSAGSLPAGVTLGTGNGALVGTPSKPGSYSVTITVSDSTKQISRKTFSIDVTSSASPVSITTTSVPDGQVGSAYSTALGASGGTTPYTWSISSGALPGGLSLGQSNGVISGTPTTSGQFTFTAMVTDSTSPTPQTATQSFSSTIAGASTPIPSVTTTSLPGGTTGSAYSAALAATGGTTPYTWNISAGTLPAGLNLTASSGVISGTPASAGNSSFTVRVKDAKNNTATKTLSISIASSGPQPLGITTTALPQASTAAAYNVTLQATGGTPGYTWAITSGQLPAGLAFMASSGTITGTATTVGQSNFTVQVTDSASTPATASQPLSIAVVKGVARDQFGGRTDMPCAQATGWFHTEQINTRWWLCTPSGNAFFMQGLTAASCVSSGPILAGKYGGSTNAAATDCINEFTSWGFNSWGDQQGSGFYTLKGGFCNGNCPAIPEIDGTVTDVYSTANLNNRASDATKDIIYAMPNGTFFGNPSKQATPQGCVDGFAPQFAAFNAGFLLNDQTALMKTSPYEIGVSIGASDGGACMSAGPDFDSYPHGHTGNETGWLYLITSPMQTFNPRTDRGPSWTYSDPVLYSKVPMASAPATCTGTTAANGAISGPCSLASYVAAKYGTVSALNAAWGSTYTTLGSSGTGLGYNYPWLAATGPAISLGTGNGSTLSFAAPTHANVSPFSVQILVNGAAVGGDCPAFASANGRPCGGPAGTGTISGANLAGGTINYSSGALTVKFTSGNAPANGAAVTANLVWGGWPMSGPGGGTGLLDEDGSSSWVGTNTSCLLAVADPNTPGTTSYACRAGNLAGNPATINANQTLANDLVNEWDAQIYGAYFNAVRTGFKASSPNILLLSPETTGNWSVPPSSGALTAANLYIDVLYGPQIWGDQPSPTIEPLVNSYFTKYFQGPMISGMLFTSCQDSSVANKGGGGTCWGDNPQATQALRGAQVNTALNFMLNTPSSNNTFPWVGYTWWSLNDCDTDPGSPNNWGLKTCGGVTSGGVNNATVNNAYDGHEAAAGVVACSPPSQAFVCGNEPNPGAPAVRPFTDLITGVKAANGLWLVIP